MSQINLILPQLKYATRDISEDHKINASYLFYYESNTIFTYTIQMYIMDMIFVRCNYVKKNLLAFIDIFTQENILYNKIMSFNIYIKRSKTRNETKISISESSVP